jgi:hypothetical protein
MPTGTKPSKIKSVLKLKTIAERKLLYSDKASGILRQLVLAGVATCWLFLYSEKKDIFRSEWIFPLLFFLAAIVLDLLQYVRATFIFDSEYHKILETHDEQELKKEEKTYEVSDKVHTVSNWYFKAKMLVSILAFGALFSMVLYEVIAYNKNEHSRSVVQSGQLIDSIKYKSLLGVKDSMPPPKKQ